MSEAVSPQGQSAVGVAPIPGPFDEAVLLVVAVPLVLFYRRPLVETQFEAGC